MRSRTGRRSDATGFVAAKRSFAYLVFEISKEITISSAHSLRGYEGKCENVHGHNWKIKVYVRANALDTVGLVLDFKLLKKFMKEVSSLLDHKNFNDIPPFDTINPSSENIAKWFYEKVSEKISTHFQLENNCLDKTNKLHFCKVSKIEIWETETSCAIYYE